MTIITFIVAFSMLLNGVIGDENEDWLKFALDSQRSLVASFTIDKAPLVGTHNSYSSGVYSMLFKNQELSITTQLHLGVRFMELDLHYIPELNRTEQGPYRMCHSSSGIYTACRDQAGWNICGTVGIVDYGDDTGCVAANPNFTQIFEEISDWLNTNPENVLVINFDDSISSTDVASTNDMAGTVNGWLKKYFGASIYTPADLSSDGSKWPTVRTLITRGKRIIFNTNDHTFGGVYIHSDFRGFVWPESKIKFFSGYPSCTSRDHSGSANVKFAFFQEDLLIQSFYGVLVYNGTNEVGAFTTSTATNVMMCEYTTFYDFFTVDSAKSLVWSWDTSQPAGQSCGSFNPSNGRWLAEDCNLSRNFACRSNSNSSKWVVGTTSSNRYNYSESTICPTGYSFSTPRTAKENYFLRVAVQGSSTVWISMNNYPNGTWSDVPTKNFAIPSSTSTTATSGSKTSTTSSTTGSPSSTTSVTATTGVVTTVDPAQKGTGHKLAGGVFLLAFLMLL